MNVRQFINEQPQPQREMMTILRSWILDLGPHAQEKISYKKPYFSFYGTMCYLSSHDEGVDLGFTKGYEISDEQKILESKGRKQVKTITFHSVAELEENEEAIRHILNEAAILNEYRFKRGARKGK
jgi:hypothetical protein